MQKLIALDLEEWQAITDVLDVVDKLQKASSNGEFKGAIVDVREKETPGYKLGQHLTVIRDAFVALPVLEYWDR